MPLGTASPLRIAAAAAVAIVLVGGGAAAAMAADHHDSDSSKKPLSSERRNFARNNGGPGNRNVPNSNGANANRNSRVTGTIKSIDGSKIVVDNANGKSTTVKTSNKTQITTTNSWLVVRLLQWATNCQVNGARTDSAITANSIRDLGANASAAAGAPAPLPLQRNGNRQSVPLPGGDITIGKVVKIENSTITLQANNGNTLTVNTSGSTIYTITKTATVSDLKTGQSITVTGIAGKNGDVTATRITNGQLPTRSNNMPRPGTNTRTS